MSQLEQGYGACVNWVLNHVHKQDVYKGKSLNLALGIVRDNKIKYLVYLLEHNVFKGIHV